MAEDERHFWIFSGQDGREVLWQETGDALADCAVIAAHPEAIRVETTQVNLTRQYTDVFVAGLGLVSSPRKDGDA